MNVISEPGKARRAVRDHQRAGRTVGLVPTMGALHEGHRSLVRASKASCGATVVSIFVNPTQFSPGDDFAQYPRPIEDDLEVCRTEGVDLVFTPTEAAMHQVDARTTVHVSGLTDGLCGPHRPGHFDGVATVVAKLFDILPANRAFFGEKDYQQLVVIQALVRDLNLPIEIVPCPTVRAPDGLALSSRNAYLSPTERTQAAVLSRALFAARHRIAAGRCESVAITNAIREDLLAVGLTAIEYVEIVDAETLEPLATVDRPARVCLAVRIGGCRLIDNVGVDVKTVAG